MIPPLPGMPQGPTAPWNLYRTWRDRWLSPRLVRGALVLVLIAAIGGLAYSFRGDLHGFGQVSTPSSTQTQQAATSFPPSLTTTVITPTGAQNVPPIEPGSTTLTTKVLVACPAGVQLHATGLSTGENTLTVETPVGTNYRATAAQPSVTAFSVKAGQWTIVDVSEGGSTNIDWTAANGVCRSV